MDAFKFKIGKKADIGPEVTLAVTIAWDTWNLQMLVPWL